MTAHPHLLTTPAERFTGAVAGTGVIFGGSHVLGYLGNKIGNAYANRHSKKISSLIQDLEPDVEKHHAMYKKPPTETIYHLTSDTPQTMCDYNYIPKDDKVHEIPHPTRGTYYAWRDKKNATHVTTFHPREIPQK